MSPNYESSKKDILEALSQIIIKSAELTFEQSIELWKELTNHVFFTYLHTADKTKIFSYLKDDNPDEHNPSEIDLYDAKYILTTRNELNVEGIGTDKYFIIAGLDGADEMAFLTSDFNKGVAILHHDYVFCAEDLNSELDDAAQELTLIDFFEHLQQRKAPRYHME